MPRAFAVAMLTILALPSAAGVLWGETFDRGAGAWLNSTDQTPAATDGQALVCRYKLGGAGMPAGLAAPVDRPLTGARSFELRAKTSKDTYLAVIMAEEGGSYITLVPCRAGDWRDLEISLDRFRPGDEVANPSRAIQLGQVRYVAVFDAAAGLGATDPDERSLWLDRVTVSDEEAANAYSFDGRLPYLIDDFEAGFHTWITLSGAATLDTAEGILTWASEGRLAPGQLPAIATQVGVLPTDATHLNLTLRASRATKLVVLFQEGKGPNRDESNYVYTVDLQPGEFRQVQVPIDALQLDTEHSSDENRRFDLDHVGMILLIDLSAATGAEAGPLTLDIDEVELVNEG